MRNNKSGGTRKLDTLYDAADSASDVLSAIDRAVKRLRNLMEQAHGGTWVTHVNHEAGTEFALLRPQLRGAVHKPKRGEVV